jgi:hypothetical protein
LSCDSDLLGSGITTRENLSIPPVGAELSFNVGLPLLKRLQIALQPPLLFLMA